MASKAIYSTVAVVGIAAASAMAWWYQKPPTMAPVETASGAGPVANSDKTEAPAPAASTAPTAASTAGGNSKPPTVEAAKVEIARLVDETQAVGSLRSRRGVVLRPEISGRITQLNFTDGQRVRKGQVLVQFDDQLPVAQVQQSQAELSIALANQKRNQELVSENFISKRSLDESAANLQVAQAKLALSKATAARLKIIAPFDGIAGIRQVNVGDYLKDGADIVNIEDLEAIFVDFRLPERFQSKLQRGQIARLGIDALPGQTYTAQIQAIDPLIDANGRSVGVRACIDNRQLQLRPGMFARVSPLFGVRENARVIPEEAIVPQGGKQYVIKLVGSPDDKLRTSQRVEVKIGLRSPGRVEILDGLEVGDVVAVSGQQRVQKDGTKVSVVDLGGGRGGRAGSDVGGSTGPTAPTAPSSGPATGSSAPAAATQASPANAAAFAAASVFSAAPTIPSSPALARRPGSKREAKSGSGNPCGEVIARAGRTGADDSAPARKNLPPAERSQAAPLSRDPA